MLLDEIKDLIKDFEMVLIKDKRFKEDSEFKNQVKIIYNCENNLNKNFPIPTLPSIDVTPMIMSSLSSISKPVEVIKILPSKECDNCDDLKLAIEKLLNQIEITHRESGRINTDGALSPKFNQIRELIKQGKLEEANRILESL